MSIDWGIIGTIISVGSFFGSLYTYWKYRQIRKEELMTNIDIDFKHELKTSEETKYLWGSILFQNVGNMNAMISRIYIGFVPKTEGLTLDLNKLIIANDSLKFQVYQDDPKSPGILFDMTSEEFLKIDRENADNMVYFNIRSPHWLGGPQIASKEIFSEDFIIPYTGRGGLEVSIYIHSFRRTRLHISEIVKQVYRGGYSPEAYFKQAELVKKELLELCNNQSKLDLKHDSFLLYLD